MRNNSRDIEYLAQLRDLRRRPDSMIFTCENCLYTFETDSKPERCPDCGRFGTREATEQEIAWYVNVHAEEDDTVTEHGNPQP